MAQLVWNQQKIGNVKYFRKDPKDLQDLRYGYPHWSLKADKFGLRPRFEEASLAAKRKYKIPWNYTDFLDHEKFYKIPSTDTLKTIKKRIDAYAFEDKPKLKFYTNKEIETKRITLKNDLSFALNYSF